MRRSETIGSTSKGTTYLARYGRAALILITGLFLSSCAFVDNYTPRLYQNNLSFGDFTSQEALLNIVRASRHEALSFVAISSEGGMQTETLAAGLPTFTLGPAQIAAQKQFAFAGNSLSSMAQSTYSVQPLSTTNFMQGMLTPIGARTLAMLLGTHPRPWVFYATVEGITLIREVDNNRRLVYYFTNDPADDEYDGVATNEKCRDLIKDAYLDAPIFSDDNACKFSKFSYAMQLALDYGLSSELLSAGSSDQSKSNDSSKNQCCCCGKPPPNTEKPPPKNGSKSPALVATTNTGAGTNASADAPQPVSPSANATANTNAIGHICWDANLARPDHRSDVIDYFPNVCGNIKKALPTFEFKFGHNVKIKEAQFVFRSPYGLYKYLGQLLRERSAARIHFANLRGFEQRELISGPFLNIGEGASPDCLVSAFYNGESFCVPRKGSNSTAILLDILGQLKNLSISPTDLNAAFAVRLTN